MSAPGSSRGGSKTRRQLGSKLRDFVGPGKEFVASEAPTLRAIIQRGILIKEVAVLEEEKGKFEVQIGDLVRQLAPLVLGQWYKSNAKFCPPVTITEKNLIVKMERLWRRVDDVAQGKVKKKEKEKVEGLLDKVFDITVCPHTIFLCSDAGSDCQDRESCEVGAHIKCDCPRESKVPVLDLQWLAIQRAKTGEKSAMMMAGSDKEETERQNKAAKRKADLAEAEKKRRRKIEEEEERLLVDQSNVETFFAELEVGDEHKDCDGYVPPPSVVKEQEEETRTLVKGVLEEKLGEHAWLVVRFLGWPGPKRNTMSVLHTAKASLRWQTLILPDFNFLGVECLLLQLL